MEFGVSTPGTSAPGGVGAVSLGASATPARRTVLMVVNNNANVSCLIKEASISFDGVTASNTPVLVEVCKCSCATNYNYGAAAQITQWRGPGNTSGAGLSALFQAYAGYVAEPTVLTRVEPILLSPTSGVIYPLPLGDECELIPGVATMGIAICVTNPQAVNVQAYMRVLQGLS